MPIPGTRFGQRARENSESLSLSLSLDQIDIIGRTIHPDLIEGERYNDKVMREVDAEKHRYR